MKEIKLTQGKVALVDDEDFDQINAFKWQEQKGRYTFRAGIDPLDQSRWYSFKDVLEKSIHLPVVLQDPRSAPVYPEELWL